MADEKDSSIPPEAKTYKVIGEKIVDIAGIAAVTFLAYTKLITGTEAAILIALFAGASLKDLINGTKGHAGGVIVGLAKAYGIGKTQGL